ncbi:hypothetical protein [Streptomyces vilmorinianum]|uniref:hypothetical protein n=1 Tax=Streptomyces vilmorinianum TaxID=3051092 RepID=UPI0010FAE5E9|nr:hypothetical protein [Streptomyces vilmorinianum]
MSTATAQSPHFVGTPTCTTSFSTGVTCTGKVAGLGRDPTRVFLDTSSISVTTACANPGRPTEFVPGQRITTGAVQGEPVIIPPRNGRINVRATLEVPETPAAEDVCPNRRWTVLVTSVTFNDVTLHVEQPPGNEVLSYDFGDISL